MGLGDIFTRKFAERVVTSAVTMVAANYTASGIQKGIDFAAGKIFGEEEDEETRATEAEEVSPKKERPVFDPGD